jgi:hypothetical protein
MVFAVKMSVEGDLQNLLVQVEVLGVKAKSRNLLLRCGTN